jgi:hypothetical protein
MAGFKAGVGTADFAEVADEDIAGAGAGDKRVSNDIGFLLRILACG